MDLLYQYMRNLKFYNGVTNLTATFDALGNGVPRYSIWNYQGNGGAYDHIKVGEWSADYLVLHSDPLVQYHANGTSTSASAAASSCTSHKCFCTNPQISDLQFELKYARLTLLGYFPIHKSAQNGGFCRSFNIDTGFIPQMAFRYAVDRVNKDSHLLPGVDLGYMIFDTCSDSNYTEMSFNALDKNLRFFYQPPELPVITYVHTFIGAINDDVTKTLNRASVKGQRLVQVL